MKKKLISILLVLSVIISASSNWTTAAAATASNTSNATNSFIQAYWNSSENYFYCNSNRQINTLHNPGPNNGLYADYWWEAQLWETIMDVYERTSSATYLSMINDIYAGFCEKYPDWSSNPYNDDKLWWSLGCIRAYEITDNMTYLSMAKTIFDSVYDSQLTSEFGGGIEWNSVGHLPQKNVATNATASLIALRLSQEYNEGGYYQKGLTLYNWVKNTFYNSATGFVADHISGEGNGTVATWEYTYNFGQFAAASYALYELTSNTQYRTDALKAIDWVLNNMTNDGILIYEGEDDCPAFKMIFSRTVAYIGNAENIGTYLSFLQRNATQAYNHRRTDGLIGPDFSTTPNRNDALQVIASAAAVSIMNLASPDSNNGIIVSGSIFEAENARRYGIDNEKSNSGFNARGYVAGWNTSGTHIDFEFNAPASGIYRLDFRYSAAAGDATRTLSVNGAEVTNTLFFASTGSWSVWDNTYHDVYMDAGKNLLSLSYTSGNSNYLNLDRMTVLPVNITSIEAETFTRNGPSVESIYEGYSGTGYIAGWNANSTSITSSFTVAESGYYKMQIRYSAGAGAASRTITINNAAISPESAFSTTASWNDWTTGVFLVHLNAGSNTISIAQNSSSGNYLNVDRVEFAPVSPQIFECEDGTLHSLTTENTNSGYSGTGYIAGWNSDGQYIDVHPSIESSGTYTVAIRYSAGAGDAKRQLYVNGNTLIPAQGFKGSGSWSDYYTVEISNVSLSQGVNTISIIFASGLNSSNWLNLDYVAIYQ